MLKLRLIGSGVAFFCDDNGIILSKEKQVYRDYGRDQETEVLVDQLSGKRHFGWEFDKIFRRILRTGYHYFGMNETYKVVLCGRSIYCGGHTETTLKRVFDIPRGSRPLNFCMTESGKTFFGEYFSNYGRNPVRIYGTSDGYNWDVAYEFAPRSVRHIHGLFWDPYRQGIWILTGDSDTESAIWFTYDEFESVQYRIGGSQHYRAVSVGIEEDRIWIPMDSPTEQNFLHVLNLGTLEINRVASLPSSVFDFATYDGIKLLTTVPEPSRVNDTSHVCLVASADGARWKEVGKFRGDPWSLHIAPKLFQYPRLKLCPGVFDGRIFANASGLSEISDGVVEISLKCLAQELAQE